MKLPFLPLTILVASLASPAIAASAAAPDPTQAAKEYVKQGTAEYSKQHWEAARAAFLKAWALKQHYAIAANLGDVEMKLDLYRDAAEHLKYAIANLPPEHAEKRADAESSLKECRTHLSAVRVSVSVAGASVMLDGHELAPELLADELLLDPGTHKLEASKTGYLISSREFTATAGEAREVRLELAPQPPAADVAPVVAVPPQNASPSSSSDSNKSHSSARVWVLVGGGAATLVAAGFGTYFTLHQASLSTDSKQFQSEIDKASPSLATADSQCSPTIAMRPAACDKLAQNISDRQSAQSDATVAWIAAGALGVATVTTFLLWPSAQEESGTKQSRWTVVPWLVGARGGMIQVAF